MYGEVVMEFHEFLISTLDGCEFRLVSHKYLCPNFGCSFHEQRFCLSELCGSKTAVT